MTSKEASKLRGLIAWHVECAIENSWAGGGDPEEYDLRDVDARMAKEKLLKYIRSLTCPTSSSSTTNSRKQPKTASKKTRPSTAHLPEAT